MKFGAVLVVAALLALSMPVRGDSDQCFCPFNADVFSDCAVSCGQGFNCCCSNKSSCSGDCYYPPCAAYSGPSYLTAWEIVAIVSGCIFLIAICSAMTCRYRYGRVGWGAWNNETIIVQTGQRDMYYTAPMLVQQPAPVYYQNQGGYGGGVGGYYAPQQQGPGVVTGYPVQPQSQKLSSTR